MKVVFGIQATKEDLVTTNWPQLTAVDVAKAVVGRGNSVIVAPSSSENSPLFNEFVERMEVAVLYGDDLDVNSRFIKLHQMTGADVIVRLPLASFLADPQIIWAQIELLVRDELDLALLPEQYDGRFGGDVSSGPFFEKLRVAVGPSFRPWSEAVLLKNFKIGRIPYGTIDLWGPVRREILLNHVNDFWPERWCTTGSPNEIYQFFIDQIIDLRVRPLGDIRVLDLATGEGMGADLLARAGFNVVGVDYDSESIQRARANFGNSGQLRFEVGNALEYKDNLGFDFVVSACTMGHIVDHEKFLLQVRSLLRPCGYFLNAPALRLNNPVGRTFLTQHVHEYVLDDLVKLTEKYFSVVEVYGENRGRFGPPGIAHDFAVVVATKAGDGHQES